ncbi:MAG: nucleotidyltransferase domain-containing protein [Chloroflexi bacterium]|nr:nucleotidyltransferase domain-containing protein [Chloroflexota bacterium]
MDLRGLQMFFARQPDVVLAYLFGSVAKGTARERSDVDIAVLFDPRLDRFERGERFLSLLGRIPSDLATHEMDVRVLNDAAPVFRAEVVRSGKPIYAKSRQEQIDFEVRVMAEYDDTRPMREFFKRKLFQEIREGNFGRRRRRDPGTVAVAQTVSDAADRHPGE